ncbi:MAG: ATP-binding protein [Armatimonadota bacterium]|nr:ATP-binding protein [Armatimonadota bacterium]
MSVYSDSEYEELIHQYETLKAEFEEYKSQHTASSNGRAPAEKSVASSAASVPDAAGMVPESQQELEDTLKRLGQRIAMIIQAEKCLLMLLDSDRGELFGVNPAFNIAPEDVAHVRVRANQGISGEVFQGGLPIICNNAMRDPRAEHDHVGLLNVRNMISVPLMVEKRDAENRVVDKSTIGVLHVYNKRFGNEFTDEDISLLRRLAGNTASIIASSQLIDKLRQEKKELVQTLESIQAGILVVSKAGHIRLVNQAARVLFSLADDVVHKPYTEVVGDERVRTLIERSFSTRIEQSDEVVVHLPNTGEDEELIYQAQTGLEYEEGELVGVVAIFTDITQIRNVDRMKTAFVSTVSHELRTPLTNIKGFITTLLLSGDSGETFTPEQVREFYEIIDTECDRLTRLITDLLNVSRIEQGVAVELDPTSVDVPTLINKVKIAQEAGDKTGHDWVVEVPEEMEPIIADEDRLDQIMTNLINNAIKYSPDGGTIGVKVRDDNNSIVVSISDQGMGMRKEFLSKGIFGKFARERYVDNQKIYGTGLGLYLVKHMIEAHGGRIWVDSEFGRGSTFSFRLPKKPPERQEPVFSG